MRWPSSEKSCCVEHLWARRKLEMKEIVEGKAAWSETEKLRWCAGTFHFLWGTQSLWNAEVRVLRPYYGVKKVAWLWESHPGNGWYLGVSNLTIRIKSQIFSGCSYTWRLDGLQSSMNPTLERRKRTSSQDGRRNTLKALVMSALDNQAPCPAVRMTEMTWLIVVYCIEKSGLGIRLLMLGTVEPWGDEKSMMSLLFPEYLQVATRAVRKNWYSWVLQYFIPWHCVDFPAYCIDT